jgi:hypothetical protein
VLSSGSTVGEGCGARGGCRASRAPRRTQPLSLLGTCHATLIRKLNDPAAPMHPLCHFSGVMMLVESHRGHMADAASRCACLWSQALPPPSQSPCRSKAVGAAPARGSVPCPWRRHAPAHRRSPPGATGSEALVLALATAHGARDTGARPTRDGRTAPAHRDGRAHATSVLPLPGPPLPPPGHTRPGARVGARLEGAPRGRGGALARRKPWAL